MPTCVHAVKSMHAAPPFTTNLNIAVCVFSCGNHRRHHRHHHHPWSYSMQEQQHHNSQQNSGSGSGGGSNGSSGAGGWCIVVVCALACICGEKGLNGLRCPYH